MPGPLFSSSTRAPPGDPPPAYHPARYVQRYYGHSLRPVILFCSALGFLFAIVSGVNDIQDSQDPNNAVRVSRAFLAFGIVYCVLTGVEAFGFVATWLSSIPLVSLYSLLGMGSAVVVFGLEVARTTTHFVFKGNMLDTCVTEEVNTTYVDVGPPFDGSNNTVQHVSLADAQADCSDAWQRLTWEDFGWLILASVLALFFSALITAYAHQLRDPNYLRSQTAQQAPSQRFQMAPWNRPPRGPPPPEDAPYVPPPPTYPPPGTEPPKYDAPAGSPYPLEKDGSLGVPPASATATTPTSAHPLAGAGDGTEPWTAHARDESERDELARERERRDSAEV